MSKEKEEKLIDLEREYAMHSLFNHKIRALFYKWLIRHLERNVKWNYPS